MNFELLKKLSVEEKFSILWEISKNSKRYSYKKVQILKKELLKDEKIYYLAQQEGLI